MVRKQLTVLVTDQEREALERLAKGGALSSVAAWLMAEGLRARGLLSADPPMPTRRSPVRQNEPEMQAA